MRYSRHVESNETRYLSVWNASTYEVVVPNLITVNMNPEALDPKDLKFPTPSGLLEVFLDYGPPPFTSAVYETLRPTTFIAEIWIFDGEAAFSSASMFSTFAFKAILHVLLLAQHFQIAIVFQFAHETRSMVWAPIWGRDMPAADTRFGLGLGKATRQQSLLKYVWVSFHETKSAELCPTSISCVHFCIFCNTPSRKFS